MEHLNSKDRIIVFCLHSMGHLNKLNPFLANVKKPFILISAMEDTELPREIDPDLMAKIKENLHFKHWFSINKTIPNDSQFTSIPYGLNFWTLTTMPFFGEGVQGFNAQNLSIENISNNSEHFSKRTPLIYANFHWNFTDDRHGGWRRRLRDIIPSTIIYFEPHILPRIQTHKKMSEFAFVVSPFGHGFDCIRTFEALCLGCIVIMKRSFLDVIYEGLPVLLVDEWSDVTETLLKDTLILYSNKQFNYDKLKMDYWVKLVQSKF
jgi:hypothetical protein